MIEHTYENCHNLTCRRKERTNSCNYMIDKFAKELKETFQQQIPKGMDDTTSYFALDDCNMWIDVVAKMLKEDINGK